METADGSHRTVNVLVRWHVDRAMAWVRKYLPAMASRAGEDRGPDDFEHDDRDLAKLIVEAVKVGARHGGYHEAPKGNGLKTVIVGCTATLLAAFIIGAWKLSNESAALRAELTEWKTAVERRLDLLERRP